MAAFRRRQTPSLTFYAPSVDSNGTRSSIRERAYRDFTYRGAASSHLAGEPRQLSACDEVAARPSRGRYFKMIASVMDALHDLVIVSAVMKALLNASRRLVGRGIGPEDKL